MVESEKKKFPLKFFLILLVILVALILVMSVSMARTSTTDYCMSCHELRTHKDELEKSIHAVDKDKNPIGCSQCHIPNSIGPRYLTVKLLGIKDLFVHYFGDPENLDRKKMQETARRYVQDENCRACHQDLMLDTKDKKISEIGRLAHEAYLGKNGNTSRGCAGCHFNMAHLPRFDRRYFFNEEFAKRLPLKQENE